MKKWAESSMIRRLRFTPLICFLLVCQIGWGETALNRSLSSWTYRSSLTSASTALKVEEKDVANQAGCQPRQKQFLSGDRASSDFSMLASLKPSVQGHESIHSGIKWNWHKVSYGNNLIAGFKCYTGRQQSVGNQKAGSLFYLGSARKLLEGKWGPTLSLAYLRAFRTHDAHSSYAKHSSRRLSRILSSTTQEEGVQNGVRNIAPYSNLEVLETRCGVQPHPNLSLSLSYSYLSKVADHAQNGPKIYAHVLDTIQRRRHAQEIDLFVDYLVSRQTNFSLKSTYLSKGRSYLRDKPREDEVLVIEGNIVVSF